MLEWGRRTKRQRTQNGSKREWSQKLRGDKKLKMAAKEIDQNGDGDGN